MTIRVDDRHHPSCQGHIDCPDCGRECCARPVVWIEPAGDPARVVCLSCFGAFEVFGPGLPIGGRLSERREFFSESGQSIY